MPAVECGYNRYNGSLRCEILKGAISCFTVGLKKQLRVYKNPDSWEASSAYRTPTFWLVLFCKAMMTYGIGSCIALSIPHFVNVGIAKVVAAAAIGAYGFVNIGARVLAGLISDVIEPRFVMAAGFLLYCLSAVFL